MLLNLFLVPSFHYNLLSVSKWIHDTRGTVSFFTDHCEFRFPSSQEILANGRLITGLYHLEFHNDSCLPLLPVINSVTFKTQISALWHMRLGHASSQVLHKISDVSSHVLADFNHQEVS